MYLCKLLETKFPELQLSIKLSSLEHIYSGGGLLDMNKFGIVGTVASLYGSLILVNLASERQHRKTYQEGFMGITLNDLENMSLISA